MLASRHMVSAVTTSLFSHQHIHSSLPSSGSVSKALTRWTCTSLPAALEVVKGRRVGSRTETSVTFRWRRGDLAKQLTLFHGAPGVDGCPRGSRPRARRFSSLQTTFGADPFVSPAIFIAVCVGRRGGSPALYCNSLSSALA